MDTANRVFSIKDDFSETPGARSRDEGDYSGEQLREEYLRPLMNAALEDKDVRIIDLDGTHGYLTSFLEEAFGGLIRVDKFRLSDINRLFSIKSEEEPYLLEDINEYLQDAENESN